MKSFIKVLVLTALITTAAAQADETYGKKGETLIPGFQLGPKLTALGLPVPFRLGLEGKWGNQLGFGFDYGLMPRLTFSNVSTTIKGWNFSARYYVWHQAFFVGLAVGSQTFEGSISDSISGVPTTITLEFASTFIAPQIGWRWVYDSGLFFGVELGVQVPISTSAVTSTNQPGAEATAQGQQILAQINDKANTFGKNAFPHFALIQIGYFF